MLTLSLAITTVGYGEITPRSVLGRLVTLPLLVFGLLLIALPSFVLGREFSLVWATMTRDHVRPQVLLALLVSPDPPQDEVEDGGNIPSERNVPLLQPGSGYNSPMRDLTNLKLAQNQTELSRQISELRVAMEAQGELLRRLVDVSDGSKGKERERASFS